MSVNDMRMNGTGTDEDLAHETELDAAPGARRQGSRTVAMLAAGALAAVLAVVAVLLWPTAGSADAVPSQQSADAGFARDMAVHHQQAVELSFIVRDRTDDEDVRRLAYDVINTQANQRGMMLGWLEVWDLPKSSQEGPMSWMEHDMIGMEGMEGMEYKPHDGSLMPGMATNAQMDQLGEAKGKAAEILYLQLLTAHHKGASACPRRRPRWPRPSRCGGWRRAWWRGSRPRWV